MTEPTEFLRLSYSSLNTFASCPRKLEFQKLYPRRKRDYDTYAADTGKSIHAGYQNYLIHGDTTKAIWAMMNEFPFEEEFTQTNDFRSFDAALSTLEQMFIDVNMQEYELAKIVRPPSPKELLADPNAKPQVVPAVEVPFELRFKGITLPDGRGVAFIGYIDAILRHLGSGLFRTMDIKSTRDNLIDSTAKYQYDSQQIPYGVIVDHIAQESVESFEVLYLDCFVDLCNPRVSLYPFLKTQEDIQEWITNKVLQLEQLIRYMAMDYFPRVDNGCLFWRKPCAYLEPCMSRDKEAITEWFLLGEEPAEDEPFHPWVIATIDVGV